MDYYVCKSSFTKRFSPVFNEFFLRFNHYLVYFSTNFTSTIYIKSSLQYVHAQRKMILLNEMNSVVFYGMHIKLCHNDRCKERKNLCF